VYAQAHGNNFEYVGRVCQVGPNIPLVHGSIHSYSKPVQSRSQNLGSSVVATQIAAKEAHMAALIAAKEAHVAT
jgi:hypothetical protein